jgi:hypothetical protein
MIALLGANSFEEADICSVALELCVGFREMNASPNDGESSVVGFSGDFSEMDFSEGRVEGSRDIGDRRGMWRKLGSIVVQSMSFASCKSLKSICFPFTVQSVDAYMFNGCGSLCMVGFGANSRLFSLAAGAFSFCRELHSI